MKANQPGSSISADKRIRIAALLPALMMCILTLGILSADLMYRGMDSAQYIIYPVAYRVISIISAACGLLCLGRGLTKGMITFDPVTVFSAIFIIWMIVCTAVNGFTQQAVNGVAFRYLGVADFIICFAGFMGCSALISSEKSRRAILILYMVTADLVSAAALYDRSTGIITAFGNKAGLSAIFYHENHFGYFLVMAVLIASGWFIYGDGILCIAGAVSAVICLAAIGVNQTMGCILATGAVIILMLIIVILRDKDRMRRMLVLTLFLIIVSVTAAALSQALRDDLRQLIFDLGSITWGGNNGLAGHRRWELWTETIGYIRERPLFGYGCEGIQEMLVASTGISSAHCEILTLTAFFGIPGGILYLAWAISAFTGALRCQKDSTSATIAFMAACGYFISSLLGVAMFYTLPFFFIFAGASNGRNVV